MIIDQLPKVPFRQSLVKVVQLKGGDRRLVVVVVALSGYLGFVGVVAYGFKIGIPLAASVFVGLMWLVFKAGKYDPYYFDVMTRHVKYPKSMPARGRFEAPRSKMSGGFL